jgi:hypothetical protein
LSSVCPVLCLKIVVCSLRFKLLILSLVFGLEIILKEFSACGSHGLSVQPVLFTVFVIITN